MSHKYVVLADVKVSPNQRYDAGQVVDSGVVNIPDLVMKGVPLSPYYEEIAARAREIAPKVWKRYQKEVAKLA